MATGLPVRFVALLVRFTGKVAQSKTKFRQERAQPDSRWHTSFTVCPVFLADMPLAGGGFFSRRRGGGGASAAPGALGALPGPGRRVAVRELASLLRFAGAGRILSHGRHADAGLFGNLRDQPGDIVWIEFDVHEVGAVGAAPAVIPDIVGRALLVAMGCVAPGFTQDRADLRLGRAAGYDPRQNRVAEIPSFSGLRHRHLCRRPRQPDDRSGLDE